MKINRRYPIWNAKNIIIILSIVAALTAGLVFVLGHRSVFVELQITLAVIAFCLFVFLTIGLYKGIRIQKEKFKKLDSFDSFDIPGNISVPDLSDVDVPDVGDDLISAVIGIVLWLLITVVLLAILVFLANLVWSIFLVLGLIIYWVFYRAIRQVFIKSRKCKGDLIKSIGYGFYYTTVYTGWIFGVIWLSNKLLFAA